MSDNFYTSVIQWGNNLLVRGIQDGEVVQEKVQFSPSLFVRSQNKSTQFKSLYGDLIEPIHFGDINDAKEFLKKYEDVQGFPIYGNTNFAYQYISKNYKNDVEFDITKINVIAIDIETTAEEGFPDVKNPVEEVLLISLQNMISKKIVTYGTKPYSGKNTHYIHCNTEAELLTRFINDWHKNPPNIITGWNCDFFDIAYLVSRIIKKLGEATSRKLSPWNLVRTKEVKRGDRIDITYDLVGISILDYLDLYKKFTYNARESYKLDYIAKTELGKGKLEYEGSFKDFYVKDWEKFVEYNIIDTNLIDELEEKMKLIELILTMAYDAKCNYNDIFSAVKTWDCIIYNHLLKKNVIVGQKSDGVAGSIVGGYVKEPVPGLYKWVVSFDATSLYPSIIMQWNMSPETLVNSTLDIKMDDLLNRSTPFEDSTLAIAANGQRFNNKEQGVFPEIVQTMFNDRQVYKTKMLMAQKAFEVDKNPKHINDISRFNNRQMARKIQLNSLFGAAANEWFRFFDNRIAEGITLTGQYIIQVIIREVNNYLNTTLKTKDVDYAFYADTDSCYITLDALVNKFFSNKSTEGIVDAINKICSNSPLTDVINKACSDIFKITHGIEQKIFFKRESIAESGIWVAKKRYALNVLDNEGVRYKEPQIKVMGMEIVRSSTPEPIRLALKEGVKIILTKNENALQTFIKQEEIDFKKLTVEEMAFPRSVNGLEKYSSKMSIYTKGTPMHVRGALLYNDLLKKHNVGKKYVNIKEGDKIKFVYLKEPNHIRENCIAFISKLPQEFGLHEIIDYDVMFEKTFLDPLDTIIKSIGWVTKPQATLEGLFS